MNPSKRAFALLVLSVLACGWLWRVCSSNVTSPFLPESGASHWIVYPQPPETSPHHAAPVSAVFRRVFVLEGIPSKASLEAQAFKTASVRLNGHSLEGLELKGEHWKTPTRVEIGTALHQGENEILATVTNSLGPPALRLTLEIPGLTLGSDREWQVSMLGAVWQNAALASDVPVVRRGNNLFGLEKMSQSLARVWRQLLVWLLVAALLTGALAWLTQAGAKLPRRPQNPTLVVLAFILLAEIILFWNNLPQMPALLGFDRDGHLEYINYVLRQKALPLADEGWSMYQPPLFYLLAALGISSWDPSAAAESALLGLRVFSAVTGLLNTVLIFLCLRLVFPKQEGKQITGLLIAALLPAHLCLSHHITNEVLAATFVTASIYFALKHFHQSNQARPWLFPSLAGASLGLAMLTKFSALLVIPFIFLLLGWHSFAAVIAQPPRRKIWLTSLSQPMIALAVMLAICGWHYVRVWRHFGTPLVGNWDPRLSFAWWQDPGFHGLAWYLRFGQCLVSPLFSSLSGFTDGIYSSLWGDGLCSGSARTGFRPPWNYDLMNAGLLLALLPTILLLIGIGRGLRDLIRKPSAEMLCFAGTLLAFGFGILVMSVRIASYAQVKAFYALPALLPACVLCALGWDALAKKNVTLKWALSFGLVVWGVTAYASLWIRSSDPFTYISRGVGEVADGKFAEGVESFSHALQLDPNSGPARNGVADALVRLGRRDEAQEQVNLALQQRPDDPDALLTAGSLLGLAGHYAEAVPKFRAVIQNAPDHALVWQPLATCLSRMGSNDQVVATCQKGLRIDPFSFDLHYALAVAAAASGDLTNAIDHIGFAIDQRPGDEKALKLQAQLLDLRSR